MKMNRSYWRVALLATVVGLSAACAQADLDAFGLTFLSDLDVGARIRGMGDAGLAYPVDPSSARMNPAGLSRLPGEYFFFTSYKLFNVVPMDYLSYSRSLPGGGGVAFSLFSSNMEEVGAPLRAQSFLAGYGRSLPDMARTSLGVSFRLDRLERSDGFLDTIAILRVDVGLMSDLAPRLFGGAVVQDLAAGGDSVAAGLSKPRLSAGWVWLNGRTAVALDLWHLLSDSVTYPFEVRAGVERWILPGVGLRAGYVHSDDPASRRWTVGAGVAWTQWLIDYSFGREAGPVTPDKVRFSIRYRLDAKP